MAGDNGLYSGLTIYVEPKDVPKEKQLSSAAQRLLELNQEQAQLTEQVTGAALSTLNQAINSLDEESLDALVLKVIGLLDNQNLLRLFVEVCKLSPNNYKYRALVQLQTAKGNVALKATTDIEVSHY